MAAVGSGGGAAAASAGGGGGAAAATLAAGDGLVAHLLAPTGDFRTAPNAIRLTWLAQVATQLADLHDTGGVHGDVCPARIRLLPLGDDESFPSVELRAGAMPPADTARVLYMHPGLLDGSITAPTRDTDVYALGVTAWHVLSGTPPFAAAFPDGLAVYDKRPAMALLSAYLGRVPDGQALPASPMLWHEERATDLHRVWSARDRSSVTARSLAASLFWLAAQADRVAETRRSARWEPGRAMSLIVAVRDTAMARVRSCVVAVDSDDTIMLVKREVERVTGYLVEEQDLTRPDGTMLYSNVTVGSAGLHHADAVTATVGGKYGITVAVHRRAGKEEEVIELKVTGGDMLEAAVLRPIAARYGAAPDVRLSAYHNRQSLMFCDPATTTVRQHAIRPGSRILVIGPTLPAAPAPPPAAGEPITISLVDASRESLMFKVKPTTKIGKIKETYCNKRGMDPSSMRLTFDAERVADDFTPAFLRMKDGDEIHVMLEQTGD